MTDGHEKCCDDYAAMGIYLSGHAEGGEKFKWHVYRDGRHVYSDEKFGASMFAEELYERIRLARLQSARP